MQLKSVLARRLDLRREDGFTMVLAIAAMFLVTAMSVAAYAAVQGDQPLTRNDSLQKQAYAAAQAGIQQYLFDLDTNNQYWTLCVPNATSGINQQGSTANTRQVPGSSNESYAIELMPANGAAQCSTSDPTGTMISSSGGAIGALRIRATGFAGNVHRTIVAQLRENTFLDYVWFTKYETDDPQVQLVGDGCSPSGCPKSSWSTSLAAAQTQCTQYYRAGRRSGYFYTDNKGNNYYCDQLFFINGDYLQGPVFTDDEFAVCGSPAFGRSTSDTISIAAPPPAGWTGTWTGETTQGVTGCTSTPTNNGLLSTGPSVQPIDPPATNGALQTLAQANGLLLTGPSCITFGSGTVSVVQPPSGYTCQTTTAQAKTYSYPANGVIYVQNSSTAPCTVAYNYSSPDYTTDATTAGCGIAYVQGQYSSGVTVGAANDIVVTGNLTYSSSAALLGLVANGFVRVQHTCTSGIPNLTIQAAILSVAHSFLVDNYQCGSTYGTLNVLGSVAQLFRGSVGTSSGGTLITGYAKNYVYDNRLMYQEPPNFLDPVKAQWRVVRQNECSATASNSC